MRVIKTLLGLVEKKRGKVRCLVFALQVKRTAALILECVLWLSIRLAGP